MLICLGGLTGSGRRVLGSELAKLTGFHAYDMDAKRGSSHMLKKDGSVEERPLRPYTDELRTLLYKKALADFPKVSKMYPDMIMEDAFHRQKPREYFFSEARKYFQPVVFVWIESDPVNLEQRLRNLAARGRLESYEIGVARRAREMERCEHPGAGVRTYTCTTGDAADAAALWKLIQENIESR